MVDTQRLSLIRRPQAYGLVSRPLPDSCRKLVQQSPKERVGSNSRLLFWHVEKAHSVCRSSLNQTVVHAEYENRYVEYPISPSWRPALPRQHGFNVTQSRDPPDLQRPNILPNPSVMSLQALTSVTALAEVRDQLYL